MASASATEAAAGSSSANGASGGDGETAGTTLPLFATRKAEVMVRTHSTALARMVGVGAAVPIGSLLFGCCVDDWHAGCGEDLGSVHSCT